MRLSEHAKATVRHAVEPVNVWDGPVGSSKTQTSTLAWIRYLANEAPPGNLAMVGHSQDSVHRNVVPALRQWLGHDRIGVKQSELKMLGRTVYIFGGATEAHQAAIAGPSFAGAYVDECSLIAESMWNMLLTRLRVPGHPRLFGTTNPASPRHWLYQRWVSQPTLHLRHDQTTRNADGRCARFTMAPSDNLGMEPEYWERMQRSYTGAFYKRYILGEWVAAEGAVWPLTTDQVVDRMEADVMGYFIGLDHGTTNPTAAMLVAEGADCRAYVVDEMYLDSAVLGQLDPSQQTERFRRWLMTADQTWKGARHARRIFVDPAAAAMRVTMRHAGWPVAKGDNDVAAGIHLVGSMMSTDRLRILRRCGTFIDEAAGYLWDEKASEKGKDEPLKVADHFPDGFRYEAMGRRHLYQSWVDGRGVRSAA